MAKEQVKKTTVERKNYRNIPERVRKEVKRFALVNGPKAVINRYSIFIRNKT